MVYVLGALRLAITSDHSHDELELRRFESGAVQFLEGLD
jgi:hypothetical protein